MRLLDGLLAEDALRAADDALFALYKLFAQKRAELPFRQFLGKGGLDVARKGDDDVFGAVALLFIGKELLPREALHVLLRTQDVAPVVVVPERRAREKIEAQVLGRIFVHADLFDHDALLARHLVFGEGGAQKELGKEGKRLFCVIARRLCVVAGEIFPREGVDLRADRIEGVGKFKGGEFFRALELHMFDEVGDAVLLVPLEGGARTHEHAHRDGQQPLHALGDDAHAVWKCLCRYHIVQYPSPW